MLTYFRAGAEQQKVEGIIYGFCMTGIWFGIWVLSTEKQKVILKSSYGKKRINNKMSCHCWPYTVCILTATHFTIASLALFSASLHLPRQRWLPFVAVALLCECVLSHTHTHRASQLSYTLASVPPPTMPLWVLPKTAISIVLGGTARWFWQSFNIECMYSQNRFYLFVLDRVGNS